jgi:hypothetical protein
MLLLSLTLTALEKQWVLDQADKAGDNHHLDKCGPTGLSQTGPSQEEEREGEDKDTGYLKRNLDSQFQQEIRQCLRYDPKLDPENDKDEWNCNHFIHCILEGLRRAKVKPLNYSQVTAASKDP